MSFCRAFLSIYMVGEKADRNAVSCLLSANVVVAATTIHGLRSATERGARELDVHVRLYLSILPLASSRGGGVRAPKKSHSEGGWSCEDRAFAPTRSFDRSHLRRRRTDLRCPIRIGAPNPFPSQETA